MGSKTFSDIILEKYPVDLKKFSIKYLKHRISNLKEFHNKINELKKDIVYNPPTFELIWEFIEMLIMIETSYFEAIDINKVENNYIDTCPINDRNTRGFIIKKKKYHISYNLIYSKKTIRIHIDRKFGSSYKSNITISPSTEIENEEDRRLFYLIEKELVKEMIRTFKLYYKIIKK